MFALDVDAVPELTFSFALIDPGGMTDAHIHDRPELIFIVSGHGQALCDSEQVELQPDVVLWCKAGERHQIINTGAETLKLATVFVPGYTARENYDRCLTAAQGG